jgi:hypothetical protein
VDFVEKASGAILYDETKSNGAKRRRARGCFLPDGAAGFSPGFQPRDIAKLGSPAPIEMK